MAAAHHHAPNPIHEVQDQVEHWPLFELLFQEPLSLPLYKATTPVMLFGYEWYPKITKFMVLELVAAALIIVFFVPLARRMREGQLPRGWWWNLRESVLGFVRDQIAKPTLGHDADRFVPYLWTLFLFILFCNLLGMIPLMGSPTASIWVTGGLALISFVLLHGAPIHKMGVVHYFGSIWPHIDAPTLAGRLIISGMIFVIELMGTVIKSIVLSVRLFANMFAGHLVLANILLFIYLVGMSFIKNPGLATGLLWGTVTVASVAGLVALSLLELFVALLQAYVFVYLTALFLGMGLHPQH